MTEFGVHPQRLDLTVHAGDPVAVPVSVLDEDGVARSLAGWTAAATAKAPDGQLLHDFAPTISTNQIQLVATAAQTGAWAWSGYAARLVVTGTPSGGSPTEVAVGWIRLYRP